MQVARPPSSAAGTAAGATKPRPGPLPGLGCCLGFDRVACCADRDSLRCRLGRLRHTDRQHTVLELGHDVGRIDLLGQLELAAPVTPGALVSNEVAMELRG